MSRELTKQEYDLIKEVNKLCQLHKDEEAEKIFGKFIKQNLSNIEMLLRFGFFEYYRFHDDLQCIHYLKLLLNLDPNNTDALILLSDSVIARHDKELKLLNRLYSVDINDPEHGSMIEYCKSLFYQDENDYKMQENVLKKSIELYPKHVFNYLRLAAFYKNHNNLIKAVELMEKALKNITLVYPISGHDIDYTDYQEYFNELIKRIHVPQVHYESYINELNELKRLSTQVK